ncbi:MAG: MerR family transcriptional regulator [Actinomycetota bacterium]
MSTAADPAASTDPVDLTIDQIAQEAGLPVSTVRLYQNKGLLPPPERRGRVGYYNAGHRDRLRLIAHLQERGFSLAAIKEAVDSWNAGRSLGHLLGVGAVAPALDREPLRLSPVEMAEKFEGIGLTQEDIQRAVALGIVTIDGADMIVRNSVFADIGPAVARLGVPITEILDEYEAMAAAVAETAERFRQVFERHLWQPFEAEGMPTAGIETLTAQVGQLTELATSVVTTELHERFARFADDYLDRATGSADGPPDAD